jgi:hypothetical protein
MGREAGGDALKIYSEDRGMLSKVTKSTFTALALAALLVGCAKKASSLNSAPQAGINTPNGIEVGMTQAFHIYKQGPGSFCPVVAQGGYSSLTLNIYSGACPPDTGGTDLVASFGIMNADSSGKMYLFPPNYQGKKEGYLTGSGNIFTINELCSNGYDWASNMANYDWDAGCVFGFDGGGNVNNITYGSN